MPPPTFPDNLQVDVHDLAAIILDCHYHLETTFAGYQLVEVNRGTTPLQSLPECVLPREWHIVRHDRLSYILKKEPNAPSPITLETFAHPNGVKTPSGEPLTRKELEDIFRRCKCYNSGSVLVYIAQQVLSALPASTQLVARTSQGHTLTFAPHQTAVAEILVEPRSACLHIQYADRPDLGPTKIDMQQQLSGFDGGINWPWLLLGAGTSPDLDTDTRVALDLGVAQLGARGLGGEPFALERSGDHYDRVLIPRARDLGAEMRMSTLQCLSPADICAYGEAVKALVLERLAKVVAGDDHFCRYCGKEGVDLRCSQCKKAYFCAECQSLGWKYHKRWCN